MPEWGVTTSIFFFTLTSKKAIVKFLEIIILNQAAKLRLSTTQSLKKMFNNKLLNIQ